MRQGSSPAVRSRETPKSSALRRGALTSSAAHAIAGVVEFTGKKRSQKPFGGLTFSGSPTIINPAFQRQLVGLRP